MKKILYIFLLLTSLTTYAHEQWFITKKQMQALNGRPHPEVFSQLNFFNTTIILFAIALSILWVRFDTQSNLLKTNMRFQKDASAFILRIFTGSMLLLSSIGLLSAFDISSLVPTLLAPDLIIPQNLIWLRWLEALLGIFLLMGFLIRLNAFLFMMLLCGSIGLYGKDVFQYFGFYLGIFIFLLLEGAGKFAIDNLYIRQHIKNNLSILCLQILTGLNFTYSAISIKFLQPNVDVALLEKTHAFTFGLPYDYFAFLMFVVEITVGLLFIIGARLNVLAIFLLILFTFLSINLAENILLHLFIYGILISFVLLKGINLFSINSKESIKK